MQNNRLKITMILAFLLVCNITSAKIIYVDDDAAGANDGSSWENAYIYLQDALADANSAEKHALSLSNGPVEIRVAQGIYTPDKGGRNDVGDIYATFNLINGVTISGGYAGIDTNDPDARNVTLYETILSGDLLGNDVPVADPRDLFGETTEQGSRYDNSYNVVAAINTDETAILDGFTITGGIASDDSINIEPQSTGGGLYCSEGSPKTINCKFTFNAAYEGGAMYNLNSNPTLINCRFEKNAAISEEDETGEISGYGGSGGAMLNNNSSPTLTNCMFTGNYSTSGGGMLNLDDCELVLKDCTFIGNMAKDTGGGMMNYLSSPILTNCLFEGNSAKNGGGLHNFFNTPILTGCTFIGNHAGSDGGGILNENSEPNLTDCTFISNKAGSGGAISNEACMNLVISNCTFNGNSARDGGATTNWYSELSINNSSFSGNAAFGGGAIQSWYGNLTITNTIFAGNAAQQGSALQNSAIDLTLTNCTFHGNAEKIYTGYFPTDSNDPQDNIPPGVPDDEIPDYNLAPSNVNCVNCIIRDDANSILNNDDSIMIVNYSNILGGFEGVGNIDAKPLFVNPGYWANVNDPNIVTDPNDPNAVWIDGDYHLKSQAGRFDPITRSWLIGDITSRCIDAGDPNSPVADEPEPNGGRINMGAYGGTIEASKSYIE